MKTRDHWAKSSCGIKLLDQLVPMPGKHTLSCTQDRRKQFSIGPVVPTVFHTLCIIWQGHDALLSSKHPLVATKLVRCSPDQPDLFRRVSLMHRPTHCMLHTADTTCSSPLYTRAGAHGAVFLDSFRKTSVLTSRLKHTVSLREIRRTFLRTLGKEYVSYDPV